MMTDHIMGVGEAVMSYMCGRYKVEQLWNMLCKPHPEWVVPQGTLACPPLKQCISFRNLTFRYGANCDALSNVSFDIRCHQTTAIIGATGSGKSTTLTALLKMRNTPDVNISTIEDPVEYKIAGVNHIQVNTEVNLTFAAGLRALVRQDPNVILVGEIRDGETADIAVNAALTGHLLLSTLHANDAPTAVPRLLEMGVEPFLISSSVIGILAQRLLRTVCHDCAKKYVPTAEELARIGITPEELKGRPLYRPVGCPNCLETGYAGRTGIHERMLMSDALREAIMRGDDSSAVQKIAQADGMKSLRQDAANKVISGATTVEEVIRATQES
jgi:general secretion pathway protein E